MKSIGRALEAVNDKGDSWRYSISITNRPRRCFLSKEVISTGKGDRSVVGHSWGFPEQVPAIIEMEAGCGRDCCIIGLMFKVQKKPKSVTGNIQDSKAQPNVIWVLFL